MEADEKLDIRRQRFEFVQSFIDRQRFFTWLLSFLLLFGATWSVVKDHGLPGGSIFSLLMLYIGAIVAGWLIEATLSLPPLLGMLIVGLSLRNIPYLNTIGRNMNDEWSSVLRMLALTVLLLLAGLGMDPRALRRMKQTIVLMGVVPFLVETVVHAVLSHFILGFSWSWSFLLGFALAGASGAIIIPGMLAIQQNRMGNREIPTLTIAASAFDDVLAILGVGLFLEYVFPNDTLATSTAWTLVLAGPLVIIAGTAFGTVAGLLLWYIPNKNDPYVHEFRAALLFGLGTFAMFGSQYVKLEGAGAFGCVVLAFVAGVGWRRQERQDFADASNSDTNKQQQPPDDSAEVASWNSMFDTAPLLSNVWLIVFQPLLFVLIGAAVGFEHVDWSTVGYGLIMLALALAARSAATVVVLARTGFTWKEMVLICFTWWAKAGLQAAVGPLALDEARRRGAPRQDHVAAQQVLTLAVLSIIITAPLGAICMTWGAKALLQKRPAAVGQSIA